jgi:benzodiazapine receptor
MKASTRSLILVNTIAFLGVLVINYLANALPLNGKNTGELSDQYPNLFTPAGLTFSIWGVIYIWLLVFMGFQWVALFRKSLAIRVEPIVDKIGWYFAATCLFNAAWMFAWHWEQLALSVLIMLGFLLTLLRLNESIGAGHKKVNSLEKRIAHWPFGIYQGWITVATIANVTAFLVGNNWHGGGISEAVWAVLLIVTGAAVAVYMLFRQNNLGHGLAVAWALYGIYLKRSPATEAGSEMVAMAAMGTMVLVLVVTGMRWRRWTAY